MKRKAYEHELRQLQVELVSMQQSSEAREPASALSSRVQTPLAGRHDQGADRACQPRVFRVVALPAPSEREKSQLYVQPYISHFPAAGEIVIFDRSWYNCAGVERVMGFAPCKRLNASWSWPR